MILRVISVVISFALGAGMLGVFITMTAITAVLCYRMKRTTLQGDFDCYFSKYLTEFFLGRWQFMSSHESAHYVTT